MIGAGPAGLMAALTAGRAGARVILADEDFLPGGRLNAERIEVGGRPGAGWAAEVAGELRGLPNVRIMPRTTVTGAYDGGTYGALERVAEHVGLAPEGTPRLCFWRIAARRAVLAAGALERPVAFPANDRPGVMLAGAVRAYLNRWAVAPQRAAVFTVNDDGWRTAADLAAAGVEVTALIDARPDARLPAGPWRGFTGGAVIDTRGRSGLRAIRVRAAGKVERIAADCLAVAGGWNPTLHLTSHLGARPVWDAGARGLRAGGRSGAGAQGGGGGGRRLLDPCGAGGRRCGGGRGVGRARDQGAGGRSAGGGGCAGARHAVLAGARRRRAGVARLSERRDGEGRRAGGAGGLQRGRAYEALHHARDGDRPGQDRRGHRRWRCWRS